MPTILVPDDHGVEVLAGVPAVTALRYTAGEVPAGGDTAEVLVVPFGPVEPLIAMTTRLPRLRLVQTLHAGTESWRGRLPPGVLLSNARGAHGAATAEWALAGLLAVYRGLPGFIADQAAGQWRWRTTDSLQGKRILILGAGDLGTCLRQLVAPFGTTVTMVARRRRSGVHHLSDLADLLPCHDVVVVMLPHSEATHHLVDKDFLARMPDGAVLVNAARGPLVDTDALVAELRRQRIRAVLDVTDPEPLPAGHPLWTAPGVLITPHVGGSVHDYRLRAWRVVAGQIAQFARGDVPDNLVRASPPIVP
ncbi:2-hydroxyacid dehydrogenase [Actinoplanes palleronii]|uniref:Phosphoglycerate dehydrogenase n=1 Tax=Actinoplanes palleronii TaxID=113570 RepID=A0ABQ4BT40_9ACTN|nr:2-hydroxyacid dehydrogenase [Actinoplanes palleronii]GIE73853.1 phosphoglycerate dehydrogenase [Actinoplanes palleronii]